jgi:predicted phosphodiesterase
MKKASTNESIKDRILRVAHRHRHYDAAQVAALLGCSASYARQVMAANPATDGSGFAAGSLPERVKAVLLKTPTSVEDLAVGLKATAAEVEASIAQLRAASLNVVRLGDWWAITREPAPRDGGRHVMTSGPDGYHKFGALGDTHLASNYERLDVLNDLYDFYASEGVTQVFHCGNWIEGECRFNRYELKTHGVRNQLKYMVDNYPRREGITTYCVAGDDHEGWYAQREGMDIGRMMQDEAERAGRFDLVNLGYQEAFVDVVRADTGAVNKMLVSHPGGGSAYAISYAPQKIVEALQGGEKPAVLLLGHYHKMSADNIRNVWVVQVGCTKDLDSFGRKKKLSYHVGGTMIEMWQDERGAVTRFKPELRRYFDRGYYNGQWGPDRDRR